jgi:hypothetical protein
MRFSNASVKYGRLSSLSTVHTFTGKKESKQTRARRVEGTCNELHGIRRQAAGSTGRPGYTRHAEQLRIGTRISHPDIRCAGCVAGPGAGAAALGSARRSNSPGYRPRSRSRQHRGDQALLARMTAGEEASFSRRTPATGGPRSWALPPRCPRPARRSTKRSAVRGAPGRRGSAAAAPVGRRARRP